MSTVAKLSGSDFDAMVERGAFNFLEPMKIELIHGALRFKNPARPPEYWIVDISAEQVHVHRGPSQGQYQLVEVLSQPLSVSPLCEPSAVLKLGELFDLDS